MSDNSFKIKNSAVIAPKDLTTLVNPEAGEIACDINDANKIKRYNTDAAAWVELGSGGGLLNYIDNDDFEAGTTGYATYADAADSVPIDGTGGTANVTITATASTPLRGTKSGLITKDAANRQGQGVSYGFSIDPADQAKVLRVSFDYSSSPNYVDGDMRVYVYDVTNSRMIEVIDRDLQASALGRFVGTFQSSADSTSYRLIFHVASVNDLAYTVELDTVFVGEQNIVRGPIVTDPQITTLTIRGVTSNPTKGTMPVDKLTYWRSGKFLMVQADISATGTGTLGSGAYYFPLPNGLSVDTNFVSLGSAEISRPNLGSASLRLGTTGYWGHVSTYDENSLRILVGNDTVPLQTWSSTLGGFTVATRMSFEAAVPIQGWSSNVVLSEDAGNRGIVCNVSESLTQSISDNTDTKVAFTNSITKVNDTTSSWDVANDRFVVPESGFYDLNANIQFLSTGIDRNGGPILYVNGSLFKRTLLNLLASNSAFIEVNSPATYLSKGDYVELYVYQNSVSDSSSHTLTRANLTIAKRSSPQTIAASEVVAANAQNTSGQAISSTASTIVFETKVFDTHNSLNTSNGIFTAPQTGYYQISGAFRVNTVTLSTAQFIQLQLVVNGTTRARNLTFGNGGAAGYTVNVSSICFLNKGETCYLLGASSVATSITTTGAYNYISISKINGVS